MLRKKSTFLVILVALLFVLSVSFVGCGPAEAPEDDPADEPGEETGDDEETAEPGEPEYEWRFGAFFAEWHPLTKGAQKFADTMRELTNGRVVIDVYPSMQLGDGEEMIEGVQLGTIEMCEASLAWVAGFDDSFYVFNLPFLFQEPEVAYAFFDGPIGQEFIGEIGNTGIRMLGFWENGVRHITSNKGPIVLPEDIQGQDIRTMPNEVHLEAFKQVGANPMPLAFGEVFTALQQGVIDGQENPLANIKDMSFQEVQDYLTISGHFYDATGFYINKELYDSLPADIQAAIDEAAVVATKYHRQVAREADEELLEEFMGSGEFKEITVLTPEQKAVWQEAMSGTYDVFRDQIGSDFLDRVLEEADRLHELYYAGELDVSDLY
ncbi:MAG: DctP family TRAP transporter solute-binding subunit [Dethiobacteria bacterium]|jgi:tripartite ATP-independent transporter DctP family solute receptor